MRLAAKQIEPNDKGVTLFDTGNDNRHTLPRFTSEAMWANYRIINVQQRFGREYGMTSAQFVPN